MLFFKQKTENEKGIRDWSSDVCLTISGKGSADRLVEGSPGADWPAYGRTYGEQHYSPLDSINSSNVERLGLAWSIDLDTRNSASAPIAIDGTLYFATGHSIIHAVEAATGKELWTFDSKAVEAAGVRLRQGWGSRGIA